MRYLILLQVFLLTVGTSQIAGQQLQSVLAGRAECIVSIKKQKLDDGRIRISLLRNLKGPIVADGQSIIVEDVDDLVHGGIGNLTPLERLLHYSGNYFVVFSPAGSFEECIKNAFSIRKTEEDRRIHTEEQILWVLELLEMPLEQQCKMKEIAEMFAQTGRIEYDVCDYLAGLQNWAVYNDLDTPLAEILDERKSQLTEAAVNVLERRLAETSKSTELDKNVPDKGTMEAWLIILSQIVSYCDTAKGDMENLEKVIWRQIKRYLGVLERHPVLATKLMKDDRASRALLVLKDSKERKMRDYKDFPLPLPDP